MTTIIATNDYLIADHRVTYTSTNLDRIAVGEDSIYKPDRDYLKEVVDNRCLKITIMGDTINIFKGPLKKPGPRLIATATAGSLSLQVSLKEKLSKASRLTSSIEAFYHFKFLKSNGEGSIIYYFEDGSTIVHRNVGAFEPTIEDYAADKPYYISIGTGSNVISKHNLINEGDLTARDFFSIAAISDRNTSLSYSVLGRKENKYYPYVEEDEEAFIEHALEIRNTHSLLHHVNR